MCVCVCRALPELPWRETEPREDAGPAGAERTSGAGETG